MSDVMSSWIKILLGLVVLAVVGVGVSLIFKNQIIDFFKNLVSSGTPATNFLPLVK
ncbi:MAG TPA: hypothetical protein VMC80_02450 [Patescibacteria group bacterium]|nr:hypothetical protein [Patescibacteria group bacterium]